MFAINSPAIFLSWIIGCIGLLIAAYTDIKTREVPDWLNYSLIGFGILSSALYSVIFWNAWYVIGSVVGLVICLIIAYAMFYTGQWGGGDSKIIIAMGALFGLHPLHIALAYGRIPFLIDFFINILLAGAVYGIVWSILLAVRKKDRFLPEFKRLAAERNVTIYRYAVLGLAIIGIILAFFWNNPFKFMFLSYILAMLIMFYLWLFVKAVEKSCMLKEVLPEKLTEGDWIVNDIVIGKKRIAGPKDLGISKEQIAELIAYKKKNKIKTVLIKEGIPFVPSFLIAFLITTFFMNWYLLLL
ncbi:MAG: prepilin peptidase [Nanoarchaeota archaeon]